MIKYIDLSEEQRKFIEKAKEGKNILVDACIGSGKTTAIQNLCNMLPSNYQILYLTYNKLLKVDAKTKIKRQNVMVSNYHGFAYASLIRMDVKAGIPDLIQTFNKIKPKIAKYDVLIIDEYQDIEQELADMLNYIKSCNIAMQIIAVGDMEQKIYDKTTLNVIEFIKNFLGTYEELEFTQCFRLSSALANRLGNIWSKKIVGVNKNCSVETMTEDKVVGFLSRQEVKKILCLGERNGRLADVLNSLEEKYPEKFNKKTVYASIREKESGGVEPNSNSAIFTTFDSSKGLERPICVIFDFTENYWQQRIRMPQQSYKILRNIFCVAASRGKDHIIFVGRKEELLSDKTLKTEVEPNLNFKIMGISEMFDFKYKENVEECFSLLKIEKFQDENQIINVKTKDGLIDLSPCIGIYQEAIYFKDYDIENEINLDLKIHNNKRYLYAEEDRKKSIEEKVLILTAIETGQDRYTKQVEIPFILDEEKQQICERLSTKFKPIEQIQKECIIEFFDEKGEKILFSALGRADVIKDKTVYELKFVSELSHEHFLQCACYMVALKLDKGVLWNIRNNMQCAISIPDKAAFMDAVARAVTKNHLKKYIQKRKHKWNILRF